MPSQKNKYFLPCRARVVFNIFFIGFTMLQAHLVKETTLC